jgi:hypothetical protein
MVGRTLLQPSSSFAIAASDNLEARLLQVVYQLARGLACLIQWQASVLTERR